MKRNWETMRRIFTAIEEMPGTAGQLDSDRVPGVLQDEAAFHMRLLIEAGLVEGGCREAIGPEWCYVLRLKWQGHQLLAQIRKDTIWNKIKEAKAEIVRLKALISLQAENGDLLRYKIGVVEAQKYRQQYRPLTLTDTERAEILRSWRSW